MLRYLQRYAFFVAIGTALTIHQLIMPDNSPFWIDLVVLLVVTLMVYIPLHKDGFTKS